jgi:Flp pilus assembly pilin Flp
MPIDTMPIDTAPVDTAPPPANVLLRRQRGQATAEYALVLLGAAAIALLLVAWATDSDAIGRLLDGVLDRILGQL